MLKEYNALCALMEQYRIQRDAARLTYMATNHTLHEQELLVEQLEAIYEADRTNKKALERLEEAERFAEELWEQNKWACDKYLTFDKVLMDLEDAAESMEEILNK